MAGQSVNIEKAHVVTGGLLGKQQLVLMDSELKHVGGKSFFEMRFGSHGKVLYHKLFTGVARPMDRTDDQDRFFKLLSELRVAATLESTKPDKETSSNLFRARTTPYMRKKEKAQHKDLMLIDAAPKTVTIKIPAGDDKPPFEMLVLSSVSQKDVLCVEFTADNLGFIVGMCKVQLQLTCLVFHTFKHSEC